DNGDLQTTPGHAIEYSYIARYLVDVFDEYAVEKIAFDDWNMRHLRPWLIEAGLSEEFIDEHFEPFRQGYKSMSPALRDLEASLLNGRIRHGSHPVLDMCAANATVRADEAGNRKLDKKRSSGRIDGMVALTMAHSVMPMEGEAEPVSPWEDPNFSLPG
ncbi:MAG: terminase large subunit, partial [Spiribacter salinus]